jgi:hypothetical protein
MTKNSTGFEPSDKLALQYIKEKGYASYSSLKNVRDCVDPSKKTSAVWFDVGTEVHSRFLEKKKPILKLSTEDTKSVVAMVEALELHPVVRRLMFKAQVEQYFKQKLWGLMVSGYIDILPPKDVADLKTTRHKNQHDFAANMDFLQAAMYRAVTKRKDFYYIGIQKEKPFNVFIFNVHQYPDRIKQADEELKYLIKYVKKQTGL